MGPMPIRIVKTGVPATSKAEAKSSRYLFKPPGFSWASASPTMRTVGRSEGTPSVLVLAASPRMILPTLAKPGCGAALPWRHGSCARPRGLTPLRSVHP